MKYKLKKDIVFPAGTVFSEAPFRTERTKGHIDTVIGLTGNTSGIFTYFIDDDHEEISNFFEEIDDKRKK